MAEAKATEWRQEARKRGPRREYRRPEGVGTTEGIQQAELPPRGEVGDVVLRANVFQPRRDPEAGHRGMEDIDHARRIGDARGSSELGEAEAGG